ncbi:MAG: class I SAM-dependent methyltransferase [Acidimicrobiales bacterium]
MLDLGAGTGAATRAVVAAGGRCVAADVALGMLQAIDEPRPPSTVADARALPVASGRLDGVVAAFSINHVSEPCGALLEAIRVVRAGSPLLVSAYAHDDSHPVKAAVDSAAAELGWHPDSWVADLRADSTPLLATVAGARRIATQAGLPDACVELLEVPFPDLDAADLVAWRCGMAQVAPFVERLTGPERARLHRRAAELLGTAPVLTRRMIAITAIV